MAEHLRRGAALSADGTAITYVSLGSGPGLVVVGGVLSSASSYLPLAEALSTSFTVHVVNRRGRPPTGRQRPDHSIDDERADLVAVAAATGARRAFGHSFGGLIVLETARQHPIFDELYLYEPGVSISGSLDTSWLDGYQRLLKMGDRRGAFAFMVKNAGFAPRPLTAMPLWCVKAILRVPMRGDRWSSMAPLLEANLAEHRIVAALDEPSAARFSTITARTRLLGGEGSPSVLGEKLLEQIGEVIPRADVQILPRLGHLAPEDQPSAVAAAIRTSG